VGRTHNKDISHVSGHVSSGVCDWSESSTREACVLKVKAPVSVVIKSVIVSHNISIDCTSGEEVRGELDDGDSAHMVCSVGVWATESGRVAVCVTVGDGSTEPIPVGIVSVEGFVRGCAIKLTSCRWSNVGY
jgi:hypothetical protein